VIVHIGDCREILPTLPANSFDSCVTDPPYELGFMGKGWDRTGVAYDPVMWGEVLRVLKPGGFLLAFGGTRTYHHMTVAIEAAGFEVRDSIAAWVYAQGFPKGKGQLKPSWEPIVVARKPAPGPVLQIDACRVGTEAITVNGYRSAKAPSLLHQQNRDGSMNPSSLYRPGTTREPTTHTGRWPANTVLAHHPGCETECHADCWVSEMNRQSGARFFPCFRYEAKAGRAERPELDDGSRHATVKPLALIRWLVRLVTPPGGTVLDPFLGSGTTADACDAEGFDWVGCELDERHGWLIEQRLAKPMQRGLGL
jgi:DNA modification methylase